MKVRIFCLDKGFSQWVWLCPAHLKLRKSQGYEVKETREPPHALLCDLRAGPGRCG